MKLFHTLMLIAATTAALFAADIAVENPYVREVPPKMPNSAAFMKLTNSSDTEVSLTSAASDVANVVELHEHAKVDGMMQMRQVAKIVIPAKGQTELKPGGLHVMLIGLKHPLKEGETVDVTLNFSNGESMKVTAPVKKVMRGMMGQKKMQGGMKCAEGKCGN